MTMQYGFKPTATDLINSTNPVPNINSTSRNVSSTSEPIMKPITPVVLKKLQTPQLAEQAEETISNIKIKEEKPEDAEINEIAAKIVQQNKVRMAFAAAAAAATSNSPHARVNPSQPSSSGGGILSYLQKNNSKPVTSPPPTSPSPQAEKVPLDVASQKGKFGWVLLGGEHIPYIQRGDEKYCAVRMVEMKLLLKYLNYLNSDIYSCTCIRSYYITEHEAKLLTEINLKHCEGRFGRDHFTTKDLVVMLSDASEFYEFLDLCYTKLVNPMSSNTKERCGFVRINKDSVVPYTIKDGEKYVPLFYFEGETEALLKKAATLGPWHLAYLKFCCKIQGIRNELFSNDSCHVISLQDIKSYFPPGTVFDEYWPPKIQASQLFAAKSSGPRTNQLSWIQAPGTPTSTSSNTQVVKDVIETPRMAPQVAMSNNRWPPTVQPRYSQDLPPSSRLQQPANQLLNANVHHTMTVVSQPTTTLRGSAANSSIPSGTYSTSGINNTISHANTLPIMNRTIMPHPHMPYNPQHNNNNNCQKHPPPLIPVNGSTPRFFRPELIDLSSPPHSPHRTPRTMDKTLEEKYKNLLENNHAVMDGRTSHPDNNKGHLQGANNFSSFYPPYVSYEGMVAQQKKADTKKNDKSLYGATNKTKNNNDGWHKLIPIMETPVRATNIPCPFKMQKALVNGKMVPCINAKPHVYSELLMTVNDLMEQFFPQVSMDKCKEVLQNVLQVNLYSGNSQMKEALLEGKKLKNFNDVLPLIQLKDVMQYMPQLKYVMEGGSESAPKRPRLSESQS
ncbi:uncharacterized protein LOC106666525 isoform X2 [Cimex lectularius]|uniref:Uncharacterized protein n=1 Tax=Cimex lectularius TaxID=79782 RepID=A0A8I6RTA6_CIMLE|nr:uncharacterized protein LOC106666525 isoform X2 [Cimex lectularius]